MTAVKKLALGVSVLGMLGTNVQAGSMSRSGSSWRWTTWVSGNQSGSSSSNFSISGPSSLNPYVPPVVSTPAAAPAVSTTSTLSLVPSSAPAPVAVPTYTPPAPMVTAAPVMSAAVMTPAAAPAAITAAPVDAYIDLNGGPYLNSSTLTTGSAQAWYNSPTAIAAFGGTPTAQQEASFDQAVLSRVQQTFQLSGGMAPTLTIDPTVSALHTISVVSNTSNPTDANALGMTVVGGSGFGYIDKLAPLNLTVDQLEWAVAHNVSHELMHAFGIGIHPDQTGTYLDSASATVSVLTNPGTTFSPAAVQLIQATGYGVNVNGAGIGAENLAANQYHVGPKCPCIFCRGLFGTTSPKAQNLESPVPEPTTILVWGTSLAATGLVLRRKRNAGQLAA